MEEQILTGGNSTVVHRVGETVRRTAGAWTPRVHQLLSTLRAAGVTEVPEPFGLDESGREVLSYLPGTVAHYPLPDWLWSSAVLHQSAELLRRAHDASVPLVSLRDGWQMPTHEPVEVICHNDVAPYNMVFTDGAVSGLIDFDTASPGPRLWDLAYLAYRLVPCGSDAGAAAPDDALRIERAHALIAAYGLDQGFTLKELVTVMVARLVDLAEYTEQRAHDTGSDDFLDHAATYRRDATRLGCFAASL